MISASGIKMLFKALGIEEKEMMTKVENVVKHISESAHAMKRIEEKLDAILAHIHDAESDAVNEFATDVKGLLESGSNGASSTGGN